ncbi:dienelactone hydrolase family protein [Oricola sp.]|uniref:dienelactone hydrolase family protein n=1 Tax=Oricola sp. TaxID=1979950 RepID=UPI003BAC5A7E
MTRTVDVRIPVGDEGFGLDGVLTVPDSAWGLVVLAHGSGSSGSSPRNGYVAEALQANGFATFLFDLLLDSEKTDRTKVFDVALLSGRLMAAILDVRDREETKVLPVGLFGAGTGAAAALASAAFLGGDIAAVVARGGRPDLVFDLLARVRAPTLLVVGELDEAVVALSQSATERLRCRKAVKVIPGATHLFEEPGALDAVIENATTWFLTSMGANGANP